MNDNGDDADSCNNNNDSNIVGRSISGNNNNDDNNNSNSSIESLQLAGRLFCCPYLFLIRLLTLSVNSNPAFVWQISLVVFTYSR